MPEFYFPPDESLQVEYTVSVQPPPLDTSEAKVFKHLVDGEELATERLRDSGTHQFCWPLNGRTVQDSPIWVRFNFEKQDAPRPASTTELAFALADPDVAELEVPADAKPGEAITARVARWGALVYDAPGAPAQPFDLDDPARISAQRKGEVAWTLGGQPADPAGEEVQLTIPEDAAGTTLVVEGFLGEARGRATADVLVPRLEIKAEDGRADPPAEVDFEATVVFKAVVTPQVRGEVVWSAEGTQLELTPDERDPFTCRVKGLEETAEGETVALTCKLTSEATGNEFEVQHEVAVVKRVVELYFQRSPGFGDGRGIEALEYRVKAGDEVIQTGTTEADGRVEMLFRGEETSIELLAGEALLASYRVTLREEEIEHVTSTLGRQRRLRMLGYHLGHSGDDENGVDGDAGARTDTATLEHQAAVGKYGSRSQQALESACQGPGVTA